MSVFNRDSVKVQLTLHEERAEYIPGGILSGVVEVFVKKKVLWRGIRLQFRGEEYAKIHRGSVVRRETHVHYNKEYKFAGDTFKGDSLNSSPVLLADLDDDVEADMHETAVLPPGAYKHPFELILPAFLPPSFDVRDECGLSEAHMTYTAKVLVDLPGGFDVKYIREFYVLSAIPEVQRRQWMEGRMKVALVSHAEPHQYFFMGRFFCARRGQVIVTEATIDPAVVLMGDCLGSVTSAASNKEDNEGNSGDIRVNVRVFNDTLAALRTVRVQVKNVVEMKSLDVKCVRHVSVGEPFVFSEVIHPGEERSFVARIRPVPFFPYSSLEPYESDLSDSNSHVYSPFIPPRRQKQYVLYHQPLMSVVTAFVNSRYSVSIDFPGVNAKGTLEADNVLLVTATVDEQNRAQYIPCASDDTTTPRGASLNTAYAAAPKLHDYDRVSEGTRSGSPLYDSQVRDRTGIFPAYTAGNWNPRKEALN